MKNKKMRNLLLVLLPVLAVGLTAQPDSVMMRFAAPEPEPAYIEYCSGFSMLPVGYGNWGPMLAGIISCVLVVLTLIFCFRSCEKLGNWIFGLAAAGAAILAATALLFGTGTASGWIIVAALAWEAVLIYKAKQ